MDPLLHILALGSLYMVIRSRDVLKKSCSDTIIARKRKLFLDTRMIQQCIYRINGIPTVLRILDNFDRVSDFYIHHAESIVSVFGSNAPDLIC